MSKNILMIDVATLKQRTGIHDNIDEKLIYPEIKAAQDLYILPMLGTALYNRILNDISGGTLAGNYKVLVDDYLIDSLCNYVLSELPLGLSYQFWNKGIQSKTTDSSQNPSMGELFDIARKYRNRAEAYGKKTIMFLKQNSQGMYPEYIQPGNGVDTVYPDRVAYTCPIYLGPDGDDYAGPNRNPNYNSNDPYYR